MKQGLCRGKDDSSEEDGSSSATECNHITPQEKQKIMGLKGEGFEIGSLDAHVAGAEAAAVG